MSLFCWWSFETIDSDMNRTSEMTKMSLPLESVAFETIDTLLTLGDALEEKKKIKKAVSRKRKLTHVHF